VTVAVLLASVVCLWTVLVLVHGRRLRADWREPVLRVPVLIVESDDWGPGPPQDGARLSQLAEAGRPLRDARGRSPVITLGVVLAAPGATRERQHGNEPAYFPQVLDAKEFAPVREAMLAGRDAGLFALQLHGKEHFWPPAVLRGACSDPTVLAFLQAPACAARHESLPPHLQARWIDASTLPSKPLAAEAVRAAVADEVDCFRRVFGTAPTVAVPVTFTWTAEVEGQWAKHGIRVVVTPGTRHVGRDAAGGLVDDGSIIRNGDCGPGGIVSVVRDVYFEPALGHSARAVLPRVVEQFRLGRPALLETHRFNFTGTETEAQRSIAELTELLAEALRAFPRLRFMSTEELGLALARRDAELVDTRFAARLRAFVLRAATAPRLRKLSWASGLALPAVAALAIATALLPESAAGEGAH
jgi:hypothetical protein